jgi:23S rRNA-/tRNA-specific pseudouridylate synthase
VEKLYLARVHGHPADDRFHCAQPIAASAAAVGSREVGSTVDGALEAHTDFVVIARLSDGTALLEARPFTGRTNQIRLHLQCLGHPVVGDPVYGPRQIGAAAPATQTLHPDDPPMCLHAYRISFAHPSDQQWVSFEAEPPAWARQEILKDARP